MFELLLPGMPVVIKGNIDAGVTTLKIHAGNRVRYRVFWWVKKRGHWKRRTAWLDQDEVQAMEGFEAVKFVQATMEGLEPVKLVQEVI